MKNLLLLSFVFFSFTVSAQVTFEQVIETIGTKDQVFLKSKEWLFRTYNSGKTVLQFEDKEAGKIQGKARTANVAVKEMGVNQDLGSFTYDVTLDVKENKARITISNIMYERGSLSALKSGSAFREAYPSTWPRIAQKAQQKRWDALKQDTEKQLQSVMASYGQALNTQTKDF